MGEDASLWVLFTTSFLAATLLPGGSEAVLFGVLKLHADLFWPALAVATLGNTLGGLSSYAIGRLLPAASIEASARSGRWRTQALEWTRRYGSPVLLAAWVPIIGDPLCLAAGWLRLNLLSASGFIALGKLFRYLFIAWAAV